MHGWFDQTHTPLVLSTRCGWDPPDGHIVSSVPHALALAESAGQDEVVCCGGAQTYAAALPFANKLVLTIVQHEFAADDGAAYFPKWNDAEWKIISERIHPADAENAHDFKIIELVRHHDAGH